MSESKKNMETEGGAKFDGGKPRLDLVPPSALFAMGRGFKYGANKYDDRNWEKGIEFGRLFGALMRHLWAWWRGTEIDDESGLSHLDHAFCNLAMLNEMSYKRPDLDDRNVDDFTVEFNKRQREKFKDEWESVGGVLKINPCKCEQ